MSSTIFLQATTRRLFLAPSSSSSTVTSTTALRSFCAAAATTRGSTSTSTAGTCLASPHPNFRSSLTASASASVPACLRRRTLLFSSSSSATKDEHPHFKLVLPDMGQSTKTGNVTTWRKAEGDLVKNGDVVCEVEMDQFTVGMEIDDKGYLARILVPAGTKGVPVGEPLAVLVYDEEHIDAFGNLPTYQPSQRARGEGGGEEEVAVDGVTALKFIHKLLRSGEIKDKEFAKKLQALARQENKELIRVFEASFEGEGPRREEDFDLEFFLENAHGIMEEEQQEGGGKTV